MLENLPQFSNGPVYLALGLVGVYGILGAIFLWSPEAVRPSLRGRPSWLAIACIMLAWTVVCVTVPQLFITKFVPLPAMAIFTQGTSALTYILWVLAFGVVVAVFSSNQYSMVAIRNTFMCVGFVVCADYAAVVQYDRALLYEALADQNQNLPGTEDSTGRFILIGCTTALAVLVTIWLDCATQRLRRAALNRNHVGTPGLGIHPRRLNGDPTQRHHHVKKLNRGSGWRRLWHWLLPLLALTLGYSYAPRWDPQPRRPGDQFTE